MRTFAALILLALLLAAAVEAEKPDQPTRKRTLAKDKPALCSSGGDCGPEECCVKKGSKSICKRLEKVRRRCSVSPMPDGEFFRKYCPCAANLTCVAKTSLAYKKYGVCQAAATNATLPRTAVRTNYVKTPCQTSADCSQLECCYRRQGSGICRRRSHRQRQCDDLKTI